MNIELDGEELFDYKTGEFIGRLSELDEVTTRIIIRELILQRDELLGENDMLICENNELKDEIEMITDNVESELRTLCI